MMNVTILLLTTLVVLVIVQVIALIRVRQILLRLKEVLSRLGAQQPASSRYLKLRGNLRALNACKYCSHRQSFIKATISGEDDDFYYRCRIHNKPVQLQHSCRQYQPDQSS